ncbi:Octopamine receptor beta-1R [Stylophora pistillata]|uniref:Octopamine receptor beta-1R n=2 Tax=Stylophora pistillata TaxID=50429 RepID=A0A2B4S7P4_STYPI|nr:Octopamine receptor beta-1R [Stylophora pistillata]
MAARERSREHKVCRFADTMSPEYLTAFSAAIVLIPTLFITAAYLKIYQAAVKLGRRLKALRVQRDPDRNIAKVLKESKAARTVGIVVGVFYLCWIPFMVAVILSAFVENLITPVVVLVISVLIYSNSAINPVLYGYLNRDFRLAYKRMFSKVSLPKACARVRPRERNRCYELPELSTSSQQTQGMYISDSAL